MDYRAYRAPEDPTLRASVIISEAGPPALVVPDATCAAIDSPACLRAGWGVPPASASAAGAGAASHELAICLQRGEAGDPASARRAAELLELLDNDVAAQTWWHRAAALGDQDAIDYLDADI